MPLAPRQTEDTAPRFPLFSQLPSLLDPPISSRPRAACVALTDALATPYFCATFAKLSGMRCGPAGAGANLAPETGVRNGGETPLLEQNSTFISSPYENTLQTTNALIVPFGYAKQLSHRRDERTAASQIQKCFSPFDSSLQQNWFSSI